MMLRYLVSKYAQQQHLHTRPRKRLGKEPVEILRGGTLSSRNCLSRLERYWRIRNRWDCSSIVKQLRRSACPVLFEMGNR